MQFLTSCWLEPIDMRLHHLLLLMLLLLLEPVLHFSSRIFCRHIRAHSLLPWWTWTHRHTLRGLNSSALTLALATNVHSVLHLRHRRVRSIICKQVVLLLLRQFWLDQHRLLLAHGVRLRCLPRRIAQLRELLLFLIILHLFAEFFNTYVALSSELLIFSWSHWLLYCSDLILRF